MPKEIEFPLAKLPKKAFRAVLGVTLLSSAVQTVGFATGHRHLFGLLNAFNVDKESSLPTWLNSGLLFVCFLLARMVAAQLGSGEKRFEKRWHFLSFIFLAMSIDEIAGFHEIVGIAIEQRFHTTGFFYFPFAVIGTFLGLFLFFSFLDMLKKLPKKIAGLMVLSGALYLLGAAGFEAIAGNWASMDPVMRDNNVVYVTFSTLEEFLEMASLTLMMRAFVSYLEMLCPAGEAVLRIKLK